MNASLRINHVAGLSIPERIRCRCGWRGKAGTFQQALDLAEIHAQLHLILDRDPDQDVWDYLDGVPESHRSESD